MYLWKIHWVPSTDLFRKEQNVFKSKRIKADGSECSGIIGEIKKHRNITKNNVDAIISIKF